MDNIIAWVKALAWGALVGTAFVALALWLTPLVHADEGTYLKDLELLDIPTNSHVLPLGYSICTVISENGERGVNQAVQAGLSSGASKGQVMAVTVLAVQELCPSNTSALNDWIGTN